MPIVTESNKNEIQRQTTSEISKVIMAFFQCLALLGLASRTQLRKSCEHESCTAPPLHPVVSFLSGVLGHAHTHTPHLEHVCICLLLEDSVD